MRKIKIAILGGGLGSLSTAYWLTQADPGRRRYDITVYQQGWRLGGKGASGRNVERGRGHRIEEHGLHIWFGFYENAFRTYRGVIDGLRQLPDQPVKTFGDWRQAFRPHSLVVLGDNGPDGLEQWPILFPQNRREPGVGQHPSPWGMLVETLRLGVNFFEGRFGDEDARADFFEGLGLPDWATAAAWWAERQAWRSVLALTHRIARLLPKDPLAHLPGTEAALARLLRLLRATVRRVLRDEVPQDVRARRVWVVTDLLATVGIGILEDGLLKKGFESVDDQEFGAWLVGHGADPAITLQSNITRVLYDLMFAYRGGEEAQRNIAAGTGALTLLHVVAGYDGAFMYKMQSGMGDAIFTPLYALLKARGVRFEFFHRVDELVPGRDGHIEQVRCTRQVRLKPGVIARGGYDPLLRVRDHDTWPAQPRWEQIVNARALMHDPHDPGRPYDLESSWSAWPGVATRRLQRGRDFDLVVCGIPVAALPRIGAALVPRSPQWRRMLQGEARVATVRTQAAQLWLRESCAQMGWVEPERMRAAALRGQCAPLLGGYLQPFNTWCDMSQVLAREAPWSLGQEAGSVAYLCGQMPDDPREAPFSDPAYPRRERRRVQATARAWFAQAAPVLWPAAIDPRSPLGIKPSLLLGGTGKDRFAQQYFRANIDPSERYTLSLAGTTDSRPLPRCAEIPNLVLAGDWVRNPVLNAGCVESTVASGMAAAREITGERLDISGELPATRRLLLGGAQRQAKSAASQGSPSS